MTTLPDYALRAALGECLPEATVIRFGFAAAAAGVAFLVGALASAVAARAAANLDPVRAIETEPVASTFRRKHRQSDAPAGGRAPE